MNLILINFAVIYSLPELTLFDTDNNYIGNTFELNMHFCKNSFTLSLFFAILLSVSCINNVTLETFNLGNGKIIKVTTGWADNYLPVYFEMYSKGQLINKSYLFSETPDSQEIKKLHFKILRDKSNQIFLLMNTSPEEKALAVFDFSANFTYPGCANDHGAKCMNQRNQLIEIIERDNPGLSLERLKPSDCDKCEENE